MRSRHLGGEWAQYRVVNAHVELLDAAFDRFTYERHFHNTYAIGVTLRGVQRFRCRGAVHDSVHGDVMLIPPGEAHDGESGAAGGYAYRMFYLSEAMLTDVVADATERPGARIRLGRTTILKAPMLARRLYDAWLTMSAGAESLAVEERFRRVFAQLLLWPTGAEPALHGADRRVLTRVRDYLSDQLYQRVSMREMAAIASMSRFRLSRQFQRTFGISLHGYHVQLRLHEAKRRLQSGDPISAVAVDLGFADQSHFHRRFKGAFGFTPGAWRSLHLDTRRPS